MLQVSLNRFGLTSQGIAKKINSRCEFRDTLDLHELIKNTDSYSLSQKDVDIDDLENKGAHLYHLHAILVHSGTINSGHYYCFIRPDVHQEQWYKFNDSKVTEVPKTVAFNAGMGGYSS